MVPSPTGTASVGAALDAQSGTGQKAAVTYSHTHFSGFSQPRTYLVPERERTTPSPPGLFRWVGPVFKTSNSEFIQKCGLDAYFFLRYLRMLLKIFIPLSLLVLPVLLPVNKVDGRDRNSLKGVADARYNVTGLDQLAWGNVKPENTDRYWAHLILAVIVVVYVCAVFFDELRGYIRLRQAYLTSPQHRLRASATTVLVTSIPEKWLSLEALDNLFDVYPGGVRNIWLNRNMDQLSAKIKLRNQLALTLEAAETDLIKKCKKAQLKMAKAEARRSGKRSKENVEREKAEAESRATQLVQSAGVSSGNPHEVAHTVQDALRSGENPDSDSEHDARHRHRIIPRVGQTVGAVGSGVAKIGHTVLGGLKKVGHNVEDRVNTTGGLEVVQLDNDNEPTATHPPRNNIAFGESPEESPADADNCTVEEREFGPPAVDGAADEPPPQRSRLWRRKSSAVADGDRVDRHEDDFPLTVPTSPVAHNGAGAEISKNKKARDKSRKDEHQQNEEYPVAYNEAYEEDDYGEPLWMKYIKAKDRETMRLPIFSWSWMPSLPLIGKKVDKIYYCRKELARLNLEIEIDQQHPEKFPLMNSAFVQFNHQVAAHMACQSVAHHIPQQMAPRLVEISPDDVIWDNMSIKWWERYLRTFGVIVIVSAMVIGWAFPVAFTGLLSQLAYLEDNFPWLRWLSKFPQWLLSAIQGILPPLFLSILMALLPLILRFLSRNQGVHTGMAIELTVQNYYFAFLFVQLFLVISISSGFSTIFNSVKNVTSVPELLATNIPKASNYFFSYMVLQAMSVSAGALVQIFSLVSWFILAPMFDSTARMKWARTTNLNQMQWGTFFPVYTTLASIDLGLIYCIISPLIMIFNVLTFTLFWVVYRYNTLYVTKFRFDTGGLLFPKAINQLFTGVYVMEVCLIGMFFLVRDQKDQVACKGQAICMIILLFATVLFQFLLNQAFKPLFQYLPITLEDEASQRDEEFARAQRRRLGLEDEEDEQDENDLDQKREKRDNDIELNRTNSKKRQKSALSRLLPGKASIRRRSWADPSRNRRSRYFGGRSDPNMPTLRHIRNKLAKDAEAQAPASNAISQALFSGIHDELEDLTPDERDQLVQRAFQHEAIRMKRPVIWIPRDDLGVSDDEVFRTQRFSKHIWISNEYQALDGRCRAIFSRSPPDFSEVDLIQL
ncbi:hypothetical protein PRK78_003449 [Emydomyces testavorans]|uniref:DUF221-domain-containing protein n=1 Tax=Emydomyces testavorans TaxID=2070801 RepID=A0AAF0DI47_9EURO|nr:hypothetical protein PRK78_003449 [Emydomyces testavorans]